MEATVKPARWLRGEVRVPGDKSIAHRAVLLAALAEGESHVDGLPTGADVRSSVGAVRSLGVSAEWAEPETTNTDEGDPAAARPAPLRVHGRGLDGLRAPAETIDCGNSGTTMRLLAGVLAGQAFATTLSGDRSLRRRPMGRIAEPLRAMGAEVVTSPAGTAPLRLRGPRGPLRSITHRPAVASAQVKSCVLLAGLFARGVTRVHEPMATRDHTERLLARLGAEVVIENSDGGRLVSVGGQPRLQTLSGRIPGDISSAAYWLAAATLLEGSRLTLPGVGINPSRAAVLELLADWGASVEVRPESDWLAEPRACLHVEGVGSGLRGGAIGGGRVPGLIDELPLLAALGPFTEAGVEIRDAAELRVKESDRIAATAAALRGLGAEVDEFPDGLAVAGGTGLRGGVVDAAGDHRIALACAAVGLAADAPVQIGGADSMGVSYPGFLALLDALASR